MGIREVTAVMKTESALMASCAEEVRNRALSAAKEALITNKTKIFEANETDLKNAEENGVAVQVRKRLRFDEKKLKDVTDGIEALIGLPDPVGRVLLKRELDQDLVLTRITCPIGVIGVIFEARPDALVQISSLCIKSGNCAVLKGGKETMHTNRILFDIIYEAVTQAGLPKGCLYQAEAHSEIDELLTCENTVDLLIPRGSNKFVRYIMEHTKIPVMGHADGVCHIYVDKDYDPAIAGRILTDAKTQYPVACNAMETVLVDRAVSGTFLPYLKELMDKAGVKLRASGEAAQILGCEQMREDEFHTEYGDLIESVKIVDGVEEAVAHINSNGSHHTDCILTQNDETARYFLQMVDSAGVYRNCSTRFADGFRYGFGAEVGISTSKLHARGPVGLEGLATYKYILEGKGQVVGDYASGTAHFHHKDVVL